GARAQGRRRRRRALGGEARRRGLQELRRADPGAADLRARLSGRAVAAREAQARRCDARRALGAVHPEARDRERVQRAQRSRGASPPLRAADAAAGRRRPGGAAARRGLSARARVRHAPHRRRGAGDRPAAHDPRGPDEHPRRHPVPDVAPRMTLPLSLPPQHVLLAAAAVAIALYLWHYRPSSLEAQIALRYLQSRRSSRLLSLITVIAVGGVTLGARLASKLSAYSGDVVNLVAFSGTKFNPSLGAYVPQFHRYEVTGLFDTGMYEYDNSYVALDRRVAQRFAGLDTAVTGIEVRLADPWQARAFALQLESQLVYPYRALDWQTQNQSLFSALKLEKLAMAFVVFLICVVAAFNVVGTLTMVVRDKTREIGILLAMGLKQPSIRRIFLAQGILGGLAGPSLGVLLGFVVGGMVNRGHWIPIDPSIYFIDHLPVRMQLLDALSVIAASLLVAMLAPLYPSVQASRLDPV